MTREQLENIASNYQIKFKKLDNDNLAYAILDAEAKEASLKPAVEKKPRKPRLTKKTVEKPTEKPAEILSEKPETKVDEAVKEEASPKPRKPGRKPKNQVQPATG